MKHKLIILLIASAVIVPVMAQAFASDLCEVSLSGIKLESKERIAGFNIKIKSGVIVSLPSVPVGWSISIDNDPSGITNIEGNAIVGSAFLDKNDKVCDSLLVVEKLSGNLASQDVPFDIKADVHIYNMNDEKVRTISVGKDTLGKRKTLKKCD